MCVFVKTKCLKMGKVTRTHCNFESKFLMEAFCQKALLTLSLFLYKVYLICLKMKIIKKNI